MKFNYVKTFTISLFFLYWPPLVHAAGDPENLATVDEQSAVPEGEEVWAIESSTRAESIYPSNYGQAGIFRVRSAESLPEGALTFGIGGEFYSVSDGPNLGVGNTSAQTIAESLFVGYSPTKQLTLSLMRRSSSTTFGSPQQLISSLGDLNFSTLYSFPINKAMAIAPFVDILVASNFNNLAPAGTTLSMGVGAAFSLSLYRNLSLPLIFHANAKYHMPQIRTGGPSQVAAESYFNFSRYHSVTLALGGEARLGDFIPFVELEQRIQSTSGISFIDSPSKVSLGSRFTPFNNKSLCLLLGTDIGLGRGLTAGVPYSPGYQIIGQLSYTVGVSNTERKHYHTTRDVGIVDRKFVIKKTIQFKVNSTELEESSKELLDQIAKVILDNKIKKLLIVGHTDSSAPDSYNLKLSKGRAATVKKHLVEKGVPANRLESEGYGKRKPIASNLTEEGRKENRRVEFFILE